MADNDVEHRIREKAYELWVLEGRPHGQEIRHWDMARALLAQDENSSPGLMSAKPHIHDIEVAVATLASGGQASDPAPSSATEDPAVGPQAAAEAAAAGKIRRKP